MTTKELALVAHMLGTIFWIGGAVVAATIAAGGDAKTVAAARKAFSHWATPGMLLAWAGGLTALIPDFTTHYASAGWMHAKLTVLLLMSAATGVLGGKLRKAAAAKATVKGGLVNGLGYGLAIFALLALVLARLKPF